MQEQIYHLQFAMDTFLLLNVWCAGNVDGGRLFDARSRLGPCEKHH
ncbi:hypothetical protein ALON55S_01086 [Alishewanella longhuensis]